MKKKQSAAAALVKKAKVEATKVIKQTAPILNILERDCGDPNLAKVPNIVKSQAKAALKEVQTCVDEAKKKLADDAPEPYTAVFEKMLTDNIKAWTERAILLPAQLAAIWKASEL